MRALEDGGAQVSGMSEGLNARFPVLASGMGGRQQGNVNMWEDL